MKLQDRTPKKASAGRDRPSATVPGGLGGVGLRPCTNTEPLWHQRAPNPKILDDDQSDDGSLRGPIVVDDDESDGSLMSLPGPPVLDDDQSDDGRLHGANILDDDQSDDGRLHAANIVDDDPIESFDVD